MMSLITRSGRMGVVLASILAMLPAMANASWELNLPRGVTPYSNIVYNLHMLILWVCVVTGIVVFGAIFLSILKFRKSQGAVAAQWHESTTVEVLWTIVPFAILIAMAVPATKALIMMEDVGKSDLTIKVTGYQWRWRYEYLDRGVEVFAALSQKSNVARQLGSGIDPTTVENYLLDVDNEIVLPVNKKIRFLTTAGDVIHSWWVPALGWKRDAIPGYINESWAKIEKEGVYRGQCALLCGKDHGFMPIVIRVVSEAEFDKWIAGHKQAAPPVANSASPVATGSLLVQRQ